MSVMTEAFHRTVTKIVLSVRLSRSQYVATVWHLNVKQQNIDSLILWRSDPEFDDHLKGFVTIFELNEIKSTRFASLYVPLLPVSNRYKIC